MNQEIKVHQISVEDTLTLRAQYLWQGRAEIDCYLDNDNAPDAIHLGAYFKDEIVGILSAVPERHAEIAELNQFRLRGLIVKEKWRNQNISDLIFTEMNSLLKAKNAQVIWALTRPTAYNVAIRIGMKQVGNNSLLVDSEHTLYVKYI